MSNTIQKVICVPGGVAPAAQRYAPLEAAITGRARLFPNDLEVYREDQPPAGYAIEAELAALDQLADSLRLDRFHLVGYSGGGYVSLAYAGTRPHRLLSLAVFEPAMVTGDLTPAEQDFWNALQSQLAGLDGAAFSRPLCARRSRRECRSPSAASFARDEQKTGGSGGAKSSVSGLSIRPRPLREVMFPAYYGYGDESHSEQAVKAGILAQPLPDLHVQRFSHVHHFVAPEQIYSLDHVEALQTLWSRGEQDSA